jgi:hypothetical protein
MPLKPGWRKYYSLHPAISDVNLSSRFKCIYILKHIRIHANLDKSISLISEER